MTFLFMSRQNFICNTTLTLMKNFFSKKVKTTLKIVVTFALLFWVIDSANITSKEGFNQFFDSILDANLTLLILSILIIPITNMVSTIKWYYLVKAKNIVIGYWHLFKFYLIGNFFNLTLPSSIGGDLIRVHLLGQYSKKYADSAAIVLLERVTGLITLIIYTFVSLIIVSKLFPSGLLFYGLIVAFFGILLLLLLLTNKTVFLKTKELICNRVKSLEKIFIKIEKMHNSLHELSKNKSVMAIAFLNSFFFYIMAVINTWISLLVFNADVTLETMVLAVPIIMFIMNMPVSIGNLGIMEFAFTFVLTKFGITAHDALSLALLMRLKVFLDAGIGGVLYAFTSSNINKKKLENDIAIIEKKSDTHESH